MLEEWKFHLPSSLLGWLTDEFSKLKTCNWLGTWLIVYLFENIAIGKKQIKPIYMEISACEANPNVEERVWTYLEAAQGRR